MRKRFLVEGAGTVTTFFKFTSAAAADLIHEATQRVLFCAPGLQRPVAAALVNVRNRLGKEHVTVVLDVDDATARMGFGDFEAVELLKENDVDVRIEPGVRSCVVVRSLGEGLGTYETLKDVEFQKRVRGEFPYQDWDKPFREFEAAPATEETRPLF